MAYNTRNKNCISGTFFLNNFKNICIELKNRLTNTDIQQGSWRGKITITYPFICSIPFKPHPIFSPTCICIRSVGMSLAWKQHNYRTCRYFGSCTRIRSEIPTPCYNIDKLIFMKYPTISLKVIIVWMYRQWIMTTWGHNLISHCST